MFKTSGQLGLCMVILMTSYMVMGVSPSDLNKNKLTHPERIIKPFEQGVSFIKVIVNLNEPREILAKTNWQSQKSLSVLQEEIRQRQQKVLATLTQNESSLRHRFKNITSFSAEVSLAGLKKLSNNPMVESIKPVFLFEPHLQQGINLINASATRTTYNGQGVSIAICDTGIDYTHSALGGGGFPNTKVIGGYDTGDNDSDPIPEGQAHGTACAGIAAGDVITVGDYIGGVAYGARLYALKITGGSSTSAYNDDMAAAWDWCVSHQYDDPENPIMVISTSFGGGRYFSSCDSDSILLTSAANNAVAAGITVLVSSGNDGYCDAISSPACISSIISVGAVWDASVGTYDICVSDNSCADPDGGSSCNPGEFSARQTSGDDVVTIYSNTASFLDVLAPSHMAYTTDIVGSGGYSTGDYVTSFGGTSAACPYAAGAVAILQSASMAITGNFLTPDEVRNILTSTGDNISDEKVTSIIKPRVNVTTAMTIFNESPPVAENASKTTHVETPVTITLNATDEGLPDPPGVLSYILTTLPNNGVLSDPAGGDIITTPYILLSHGNQVIYTPNIAYIGSDSFQFKANDGGTLPDGGDSNTATVSIEVTAAAQFIYSSAMDTNPGWTLEGNWAWGTPTGNGGSKGNPDPTSGFTGSYVVGYNLSGDYSQINLTEWATTPVIDCTDKINVTLKFRRWLNVGSPDDGPPPRDHAYIEVSNDGSAWDTIWQNTTIVTDSSWQSLEYDISAYADNQPTVYIRWGMGETNQKDHYSGWNIDDVEVSGDGVATQYNLITSSTSGGLVTTPGEGSFQYNSGSVVTIEATANPNYHFVNWTGTAVEVDKVINPSSAATTVTMDNDFTVQANFTIDTFTLEYAAGPGGTLTGNTSQLVAYGSDGTAVTAVPNTGYHFVNWSDASKENPRTDENITANISVTANFELNPITISGFVIEPDPNYPIADVFIGTDSDPNATTDPNGFYQLLVSPGWSGTITPSKTGYTFEPNSIFYTNVMADPNDSYIGILDTFIISGHTLDANTSNPLADVLVTPDNDGGPFTSRYYGGADVTDANGFYELLVDTNFSGDVVPSKYAYAFEPNGITYTNITQDVVADQNYVGSLLTYTITGYITNSCELPIQDVLINANNSGGPAITDPNGYYEVWVDYNWSGSVTPTKANYTFVPNIITYTFVLADQPTQNYLATNIYDLNCDDTIELGDLAILCNYWLTVGSAVPGDFYKDEDDIVNLLDFADFAGVWGQ